MKKVLGVFALLAASSASAVTIINETFNGPGVPAGWYIEGYQDGSQFDATGTPMDDSDWFGQNGASGQ